MDCISRKRILEHLSLLYDNLPLGNESRQLVSAFRAYIENLPTADVVEVKHGYWRADPITARENGHHCSACGGLVIENMKYPSRLWLYGYCPFCGAKMDGRSDA